METQKVLVTSKGIYCTKGKNTYEVPVNEEAEMSKGRAEQLAAAGRLQLVNNTNVEVEEKPTKRKSKRSNS